MVYNNICICIYFYGVCQYIYKKIFKVSNKSFCHSAVRSEVSRLEQLVTDLRSQLHVHETNGACDVNLCSANISFPMNTNLHNTIDRLSRYKYFYFCIHLFGGKQGNAPCKILLLQQILFCVSYVFLRSQGCHKDEVNLATLSFWNITSCETVVSVLVLIISLVVLVGLQCVCFYNSNLYMNLRSVCLFAAIILRSQPINLGK